MPVLAESRGSAGASPDEARESTENCDRMGAAREMGSMADSRGEQNNLAGRNRYTQETQTPRKAKYADEIK